MIHARLFDVAEQARWQMADVRFDRIALDRVTPALCETVKQAAYAELTTASATRRFLTDFADDTELTHWMSVWFYEETRHPNVLLRWLERVGVRVDDEFMRQGRGTAPFMKSRMGTLVTNIISELVAAASYRRLAELAGEPVIESIATNLSADESRHAASFYAFAQRHLELSANPDDDRRDALKVVYAWLGDTEHVRHPVNEFRVRNGTASLQTSVVPKANILALVGLLVGRTLETTADVLAAIGGRPA